MLDRDDDRPAPDHANPPPDEVSRVVGSSVFVRGQVFDTHDSRQHWNGRVGSPRVRWDRWYFTERVLVDVWDARMVERRAAEVAFKRGWAQSKGCRYAVVADGDLSELHQVMAGGPVPPQVTSTPEAAEPVVVRGRRGPAVQRPRSR